MNNMYTISEFASLFNIERHTLLFYDKIGIFKPKYIDHKNGYRYYSMDQYHEFSLIQFLRDMDIPIKNITKYIQNTDANTYKVNLIEQKKIIESEIIRLMSIKHKIDWDLYRQTISQTITEYNKPAILTWNHELFYRYPIHRKEVESKQLLDFFQTLNNENCNFSKNIDIFKTIENILSGRNDVSYIAIHSFDHTCSKYLYERPAGQYAVTYHKGNYSEMLKEYAHLLDYIDKNEFVVSGDALERGITGLWEESDENNFVTEISIPIKSNAPESHF